MKKKAVILIFLIASAFGLFAQGQKIKYSTKCSQLIIQVATEWRSDSTGKNNFRRNLVQRFCKSNIDSVPISFVADHLGVPNNTYYEPGKTSYVYYFFSASHSAGWLYNEYLIFTFDTNSSLLLSITQGDNDRS